MKRVRCPKCDNYIVFDEMQYENQTQLVFECPECHKQFGIRIGSDRLRQVQKKEVLDEHAHNDEVGSIVVVENVFHFKQVIPLQMGDNVFGRYVRGTNINKPIETVDPSVDTKHCIIRVQHNKRGEFQYILRDANSNTGTFFMNKVLSPQDRIRLENASIITIGATTLILRPAGAEQEE